MERDLFDPVIDGVQHYTYHREPTEGEIAFGYGATHYRDFPPEDVVKKKDRTARCPQKMVCCKG